MKTRPTHLLALLVVVYLFPGCTRTLKSPVAVDPDILQKRENYAQEFPSKPHVESILANRIAKGMSSLEVKLAWGRPFHSFDGDVEGQKKLIYLFSDDGLPDTQPKTITHLFFEHDRLRRWQRDRGIVNLPEMDATADPAADLGASSTAGEGKARQP